MQQGHAAKGPRTRPALVLLHLGVGLQVGSEVGAVCEGAVAVLAREGALTCAKDGKHLAPGKHFWPKGLSSGYCF